LAKVHIVYLECRHVLESEEGNGTVKGEFLVSGNEARFVIWCEPEARNLGESREEIFEVFLECNLLFLCLGGTVGRKTKRRPER
jgi:hypothetical protein